MNGDPNRGAAGCGRLAGVMLLLACTLSAAPQRLGRPGERSIGPAVGELGVVLHGRVVDAVGEPVPAAEVRAFAAGDDESRAALAWADGEGQFRLSRLPAATEWTVVATAPGQSIVRTSVLRADLPLRLRLWPSIDLRGVLRDLSGQPVVGAAVRGIAFHRGGAIDEIVTTGADGAFVLQKLHRGPISVVTAVPGEGFYKCDLRATGDAEIVLTHRTPRTGELRVQVTGLPPDVASRTMVELRPNDGFPGLPPPWHQARLGADGVCVLRELPAVPYAVRLLGADRPFDPQSRKVPASFEPQEVRFAALPPPTVQLRLVDAEGRPCSRVPVLVSLRDARTVDRVLTRSDEDGLVSAAAIRALATEVMVESLDPEWWVSGGPALGGFPMHFLTISTLTEGKVLMRRTGRLTGRVLATDGRPVAGAVCRVFTLDQAGNSTMHIATGVTDAHGRYSVPVPQFDQEVRVSVLERVGFGSSEPGNLFAAATIALPDFTLIPPATIDGVLCGMDGLPRPGVQVWLGRQEGAARITGSDCAITDGAGRFHFDGVQPGLATLNVATDDRLPNDQPIEQIELVGGQAAWLELATPRIR